MAGSWRSTRTGRFLTSSAGEPPLPASMIGSPLSRLRWPRSRFADRSFDLIWCEGAIYILGLASGLQQWRRLLRPGGYVAVTHPCWLKADVPAGARALWQDEGFDMTTVEANLATIGRAGYGIVDHFVLPPSAWWDDYYTPIEAKLPALRARNGNDPAARRRIDEAQAEIDTYRRYGDSYGYVFFVMRQS